MRNWLELIRLPAVFSAPADVVGGCVFLGYSGQALTADQFITLVVISLCLYCAGMITNDLFDLEVDRHERPNRPLPSGRVQMGTAWTVALSLQLGALFLAFDCASIVGWSALLLCALTYGYNGVTKATAFGPLMMGLCRAANLSLPLSLAPNLGMDFGSGWLFFSITCYIAVVTLVSRYEVPVVHANEQGRRAVLVLRCSGALTCLCACVLPADAGLVPLSSFATLVWLNVDFRAFRLRPLNGPIRLEVVRGLQGILVHYAALSFMLGALFSTAGLLLLLYTGKLAGKRFYAT